MYTYSSTENRMYINIEHIVIGLHITLTSEGIFFRSETNLVYIFIIPICLLLSAFFFTHKHIFQYLKQQILNLYVALFNV